MPPDPIVSVPVPVMPMSDKALVTPMPPHVLEVPRVRLAPSEVLAQVATSPEPGAVPPQLAPAVRSVPVAALVTDAACELLAVANTASARAATRRERGLIGWYLVISNQWSAILWVGGFEPVKTLGEAHRVGIGE